MILTTHSPIRREGNVSPLYIETGLEGAACLMRTL